MSTEYDDENLNSTVHRKFLQSVNSLNKVQHIQKPTRSEAVVSKKNEFNLGKSSNSKSSTISVGDIFNVLKSSNQHTDVAKVLRNARRTKKVLKKSLPKHVEEKIQRSVGYEQARKKLNKWDVIVAANQAATTQVFPNDFETHEDLSSISETKKFKSDLMLEMEALNNQMDILQSDGKNKEEVEEKLVKNKLTNQMSKAEIIAHRKALAYLRIQYSQNSAKARKQNKIKSKSYHKFLKREKIAAKVKEIALLEKTNPEGALEKLKSAEKRRALERASLRHRNTSVWAKALQIRAKNDKEIQKDLSEQLALSRQLTQKAADNNSSDSEKEENDLVNENQEDADYDPLNPWIKVTEKPKKDEVLLGYRKYWSDRNKNDKDLEDYRNLKVEENSVIASTEWEETPIETEHKIESDGAIRNNFTEINIDEIFDDADINLKKKSKETLKNLNEVFKSKNTKAVPKVQHKTKDSNLKRLGFKKTKTKIEIDEQLIETPSKEPTSDSTNVFKVLKDVSIGNESTEIDPNKFSEKITKPSKYIDLHMDEKDDNFKDAIAAAFEDDDLVADFQKEQKIKNTDNDNVLELNTPGWGSWVSAHNINDKTPKRMILKFPAAEKKKECNASQLYIKNDVENMLLKQHLVSSLPFPFKSVQEYEASIRAPIGRSFVPETAFKVLTRPAVITKKGKIINPIDENILKSGIKKRKMFP